KYTNKPRILILTSSFPRTSKDDTCGYIREFARSLCPSFVVSVLAPRDRAYDDQCYDELSVARSWSPIPLRWDPFTASSDLNTLSRATAITRLCFLVSALFYLLQAVGAARKAALVCCHWMLPSGIIGLLCWRLLGRPFVIIEHSGGLHLL